MAAQSERPKQKLLDQVRTVLREKHYSIHTEHSYVNWIKRFILFHDKRHPRDMAAPEIETFLIHLAVERRVAASTQQQALAHKRSLDPRSGITRRHHLGPSGPQKAVRQAARSSGIRQRINCRAFRDAFAAHLLDAGYNVRTVQELLGHRDVNVTLDRHTHACTEQSERILNRPGPAIHSPLDRIDTGA
jgi:site-specific recombinase XerD